MQGAFQINYMALSGGHVPETGYVVLSEGCVPETPYAWLSHDYQQGVFQKHDYAWLSAGRVLET
jgi:hypothetical protein